MSPLSLFSSLRNRAADFVIERRLGIRTTGRKDADTADAVPYSTFAYAQIFDVVDRLALTEHDTFVDVGCGKGRVVCAAALRPLRSAVGIDIDPVLCEIARANASRLRGRRCPIEIACASAHEFDYAACTALLLFNPFNFATLKAMLDAIVTARRAKPAPLRIAYVNPRCESVLAEARAFERFDFTKANPHGRGKFDVAYWRLKIDG
jgi:SAM-dependent methyltransferase